MTEPPETSCPACRNPSSERYAPFCSRDCKSPHFKEMTMQPALIPFPSELSTRELRTYVQTLEPHRDDPTVRQALSDALRELAENEGIIQALSHEETLARANTKPLASHLAQALDSYARLRHRADMAHDDDKTRLHWKAQAGKWALLIRHICREILPHGSGLDGDYPEPFLSKKSNPHHVRFWLEYHFMNEDGFYDGWYRVDVDVYPDWTGIVVDVSMNEDDETTRGRAAVDYDREESILDAVHQALEPTLSAFYLLGWDEEGNRYTLEEVSE